MLFGLFLSGTEILAADFQSPLRTMGNPVFSSELDCSPGGTETKVLNATPGDRRLREIDPNAQTPSSHCKREISSDQQYHIYICLFTKSGRQHMTVRKTVVGEETYEKLLGALPHENSKRTLQFFFPYQTGLKVHRDGPTGILSPSRSLERALENSPTSIRRWITAAEQLNHPPFSLAKILDIIPDNTPDFGYRPLGHTQQNICPRGGSASQVYKYCQIEISPISDQKIQEMYQRQADTIERL